MIYEKWFVTRDLSGMARFYYSEIRVRPFEGGRMIDEEVYASILQERFRKLLNNDEIEVDVFKDNLVPGIVCLFDLRIGDILLAKRCGNWVDLNEIRESIHLYKKYSIKDIQYAFDGDRGLMLQVKTEGMPSFLFKVQETPMRNESMINQNLIREISDEIAKRWIKAGGIYEQRKCDSV